MERSCVGCRKVDAQSALVRVAFDGDKLVIDRKRRLPGRGAYLHPRATCIAGAQRSALARSLRRAIANEDLRRIVNEMSPSDDNSPSLEENAAGKGPADTVESPPRTKAENDRSEDARL